MVATGSRRQRSLGTRAALAALAGLGCISIGSAAGFGAQRAAAERHTTSPSAAPSTGAPTFTSFATTGHDIVEAVSVTARHGIYVAGITSGSLSTDPAEANAGGNDIFVARLDSAGETLWVRQFGSNDEDDVTSIAVAGNGDVFIGGFTEGSMAGPVIGDDDAFVARYDAKGNRRWIQQFGSTESDRVTSVSIGWAGDLYLAGWTDGSVEGTSAGGRDGFVARYDTRGKRRWIDQFGTSGDDAANASSFKSTGLYVAGSTTGQYGPIGEGNPGTIDILLARYTTAGNVMWRHQYGGAGDDVATAMALDRYGRPHLTGTTTGSLGAPNQGDTDIFLAGFRADGAARWWRQMGTPAAERSNAVGFNRKGDVFIAGTTFGSLAANTLGGGGDIIVAHFDGKGVPRWSKQFGTDGMDEATSVAVAPSGDLFVGGYSDGGLGGPGAGVKDGFLAHFDVRNNATWVHQGGGAADDRLTSIAMTHTNDVVAAGTTEASLYGDSNGSADAFVVRHDARNRAYRGWQFGTPAADEARGIAEAPNEDIVVVGRTEGSLGGTAQGNGDAFVARFSAGGRLRWVRQLGTAANDVATAVAVAGNGDVFIAGNTAGTLSADPTEANPNDQDDVFLAKYDRYGTLRWLRQFGTSDLDNVYSMAIASNNTLYLGGTTMGSIATVPGEENREGFDGFVARYTVGGEVVWRHQFGSESTDIAFGISRNPRGGIDVTGLTGGTINEPANGGNDAFLAHFSSAGSLEWLHQFGTEYNDGAQAVASMPNGDITIVGSTDGNLADSLSGGTDIFVARYTRLGTRKWMRQFGTPANDVATSAVSQRNGQLFFGGYTGGSLNALNAGSNDLFLARID